MQSEITELRKEMSAKFERVYGDMAELKTGVSELKTGVSELKTGVSELKTGVSELKTGVSAILAILKQQPAGG